MYWICKLLLTLLTLIICVITDIKTKKIKNAVCFTSASLGIILNLLEFGVKGILLSVLGICIPIIILYILYLTKSLGAGDVKLFAAIGSIWGSNLVLYSMIFSFIMAGFCGLIIIIVKKIFIIGLISFARQIKIILVTRSFSNYVSSNSNKTVLHLSPAIMLGTILSIIFISTNQ